MRYSPLSIANVIKYGKLKAFAYADKSLHKSSFKRTMLQIFVWNLLKSWRQYLLLHVFENQL